METVVGEDIFISGGTSELGGWDTGKAVALSADRYTPSNPLWEVKVGLPVGKVVEYKFFKKTRGKVGWESDPNRSYTVPRGCAGDTQVVKHTWR